MYCEVSITTMQKFVSACLMLIGWSFFKDFRAFLSFFVRLSVVCTGCISFMWSFAVRCRGRQGTVPVLFLVCVVVWLTFWVAVGGDWSQRGRGACL